MLLLAVLFAAVNTGNNLLYLVLSTMLGLLVISNALAEWNLRGLDVARRLPAEAYAGQAAAGAFELINRRRRGTAWAIHLDELEAGAASGVVVRVPPGGSAEAPTRWTFGRRGVVRLGRVRVWSTHPFGLVRRYFDIEVPAEMLVYPRPAPALPAPPTGREAGHKETLQRAGQTGDFRGLRAYHPGDPLRDLHWPTSARTGRPMVIERAAEASEEVMIDVRDASGAAWEARLSEATGQVLWHDRNGHAYGLHLDGQRWPPRAGDAWRRKVLGLLARAPQRGPA